MWVLFSAKLWSCYSSKNFRDAILFKQNMESYSYSADSSVTVVLFILFLIFLISEQTIYRPDSSLDVRSFVLYCAMYWCCTVQCCAVLTDIHNSHSFFPHYLCHNRTLNQGFLLKKNNNWVNKASRGDDIHIPVRLSYGSTVR